MSDDGLVLNLAVDEQRTTTKGSGNVKRGGRWTDRVKAKRVAKRKIRPEELSHERSATGTGAGPPAKRVRIEKLVIARGADAEERTTSNARPLTQIISSLFSSNPKVEQPTENPIFKSHSRPSNAPLATASTFSDLGLDPLIVAHLSSKMNITKPTSIQLAVLSILLSNSPQGTSARDVFIQSQTGSGKTLSYLLPIIQDLLPLSSLSYIDRSIGTLAIIIAPTRELAKQISDVLETLLKLRLRPSDESDGGVDAAPRLTRWLVSGLLTGGATRTHEKARLRKGLPILVSTPGRLLDHLQNTTSFDVGKCRWLVLDEADRLMELGFEETIQGILKALEGRRKLAVQAVEDGKSMEVGGWDWKTRRRAILCSATIREDVQKLAGTTLQDPVVIKATDGDLPLPATDVTAPGITAPAEGSTQMFTPPSQLAQKYVIVPLKLRLVTLVALLRSLMSQTERKRGNKIIVFLSCTASVDFHWHLLGGAYMGDDTTEDNADAGESSEDERSSSDKRPQDDAHVGGEIVERKSPLFPDTSIFRLHGSLPLQARLASLRGFSSVPSTKPGKALTSLSSILLCTSVASRGLDLPLVRAVVQYDLPTEGGATEYVHRVGRTARAGKGGEAWSIVSPSEGDWIKWVEQKMRGGAAEDENSSSISLEGVPMETVLRKGFRGKGNEYEDRATEVQLSFERWVLRGRANAKFAREAFLSHMRAYATHPSDEKHIFHIRHLHLGHLAKAFALREAPKAVTGAHAKSTSKRTKPMGKASGGTRAKAAKFLDPDDEFDVTSTEKRMEQVVRAQGRLTKKGGKMVSSGVSEFQIAGGDALEKLVQGSRT